MASEAFAGAGTRLQRGDGATPTESFTTVAHLNRCQQTGSKADSEDVTDFDSVGAFREKLPTLLDAGELSLEGFLHGDDATQQVLRDDFEARRVGNWKLRLPDEKGQYEFAGFISGLDLDVQFDKAVKFSGKITITGPFSEVTVTS